MGDLSLSEFLSVAEALSTLVWEVKDDDRVFVHRKHCESDVGGVCTCDPILLTGKEIKRCLSDG
jgi:hypothetical protein